MSRSMKNRIANIEAAVAQEAQFKARVLSASDDVVALADLMAEAIEIERATRALEAVEKNGKQFFCMESLLAMHCLDHAQKAYLEARSDSRIATRSAPSATSS